MGRGGLLPELVPPGGRRVPLFFSAHRRDRRAPLDRGAAQVDRAARGRVNLDQVRVLVRDDRDPVALHCVAPGPVPFQVLDMAGGVHELEPLGDAEQHGPAGARASARPSRGRPSAGSGRRAPSRLRERPLGLRPGRHRHRRPRLRRHRHEPDRLVGAGCHQPQGLVHGRREHDHDR